MKSAHVNVATSHSKCLQSELLIVQACLSVCPAETMVACQLPASTHVTVQTREARSVNWPGGGRLVHGCKTADMGEDKRASCHGPSQKEGEGDRTRSSVHCMY